MDCIISNEETKAILERMIENAGCGYPVLYPSAPLIEAVVYNKGYSEFALAEGKKDFLSKKQRKKVARLLYEADIPSYYVFPSQAYDYVGNLIFTKEIEFPTSNNEGCDYGWDVRYYCSETVDSIIQEFINSVEFIKEK